MKHECHLPDLERWDSEQDWQCQTCGQWWWVNNNVCYECHRHGDPSWEQFGKGDGTLPVVNTSRGLIDYFRNKP